MSSDIDDVEVEFERGGPPETQYHPLSPHTLLEDAWSNLEGSQVLQTGPHQREPFVLVVKPTSTDPDASLRAFHTAKEIYRECAALDAWAVDFSPRVDGVVCLEFTPVRGVRDKARVLLNNIWDDWKYV